MDKKIFRPNVITGGKGVSIYDLRSLAQNEPEAFAAKITLGAESGKLKFSDLRDLRALYGGLADIQIPIVMEDISGTQRAISASAFPILTGTLAIAAIQESYNAVPTIGQELVTEFEDEKKVTTLVSLEALDKEKDEVGELEDFPEIGVTEEKVEIRHKKNGRKVTISAEAIRENNLPDIVGRFNKVGEIAVEHVEELTIMRVCDYYGSANTPAEPYVYRPSGTGTNLYDEDNNSPGTRAPVGNLIESNALVDDSDLEAARVKLASMKNNRGTRISIPWSEVILLVPDALIGTASKIFNSELVPGVENEVANYGPRGRWALPKERIISSPKLDDLSTSAWYLGAFKRQFKRKWKLRFEYVTLGMDTQAYLNSMVAFQARIAWDCEIGAVDYVYVIQNYSSTDSPYDD